MSKYCGAILAAGRGTRMQPFSERYPKPLLPICNKALIVHQVELMKSIGITEIFILVGHKGFEIAKVLGDGSRYGVQIQYVEQTQVIGIAHAVGRLEAEMAKPFLLFLGDIYLIPGNLQDMFDLFEEQGGGGVLATREDAPDAIRKNFAITLDSRGYVTRVIEKPRYAPNKLKGVGVYLFDLTIFDAIRRTPRTALRDEYELTDAIQVLIDDGNPVRPGDVIIEDINLTNPGDLLRCNLQHLRALNQTQLLQEPAHLHPNAVVHNSIIGSNVRVDYPITIANSVIFDSTHVMSQANLDGMVVTPGNSVDCRYILPQFDVLASRAAAMV